MGNFDRFGLATRRSAKAVELVPLHTGIFENYLGSIDSKGRAWLGNQAFSAQPETFTLKKDRSGNNTMCYVGIESADDDIEDPYDDMYALSGWYTDLPAGTYELSDSVGLTDEQKYKLTLGWSLAAYRFDKYRSVKEPADKRLVIPKGLDKERLCRELEATFLVQDMINEPPNVMTVKGFIAQVETLAETFNAKVRVTRGQELLNQNYPLIHAVGKGSAEEPALVDIRWGNPEHPCVTLVGKGVVFDTGGLNMKSSDEMRDMKNDMSGAAHALGVASMVMSAGLPVNLRVLLPVVENASSPLSYKQGSIESSRGGKTIEILHTDAEGRLILSDALREAAHPENGPKPELIIDFGTLSWYGHQEYPGFGSTFSNRKGLQAEFLAEAAACQEYFAPRPLMPRIGRQELDGKKNGSPADIIQCSESHGRYDDILAANLLNLLAEPDMPWIHNDLQSWRRHDDATTAYPPNLPCGGRAQGVRTAFKVIENKYPEPEA